jgi:hypothetical protein
LLLASRRKGREVKKRKDLKLRKGKGGRIGERGEIYLGGKGNSKGREGTLKRQVLLQTSRGRRCGNSLFGLIREQVLTEQTQRG